MNSSRGSALIVAMLTLVVLFTLGVSLLSLTASNFTINHAQRDYQAAYYIAEATLRHQLEIMRTRMEELYRHNVYTDAATFFAAFYQGLPTTPPEFEAYFNKPIFAHTKVSCTPKDDNTMIYTVVCEGSVGKITREIESDVEIRWSARSAIFDKAIFSEGAIELEGSSTVYGDVATNTTAAGGVSLEGNSKIYGDLYIGSGGNPSEVVWGTHKDFISGDIKIGSMVAHFPPIEFPSELEHKGTLIVDKNNTQEIHASGRYHSIEVGNNSSLFIYLDGDTIIHTTQLHVEQNGEIILRGSGRLLLFVDNDIEIRNRGRVNQGGDAGNLILMTEGNTVILENNTSFVGGIYAPAANITISNHVDITGSIVAHQARVSGNSKIVFKDVNYKDLPIPIENYEGRVPAQELFIIRSWKEN